MHPFPAYEHHPYEFIVAYFVFSNVVSALPTPLPNDRWYLFVFNLLHGIAGSLGRITNRTTIGQQLDVAQAKVDDARDIASREPPSPPRPEV